MKTDRTQDVTVKLEYKNPVIKGLDNVEFNGVKIFDPNENLHEVSLTASILDGEAVYVLTKKAKYFLEEKETVSQTDPKEKDENK